PTPFNLYLISAYVDEFVIVAGLFVWLIFSLKIGKRMRYIVTVIFGALMILLVSAHFDTPFVVLALLSIPLCASFLIYDRFSLTKRKFLNLQTSLLYINYIGILAIIVGAISTIAILSRDLHLFSYQPGVVLHDYAYQLFDLISDVSPLAILLLGCCIPVKLIINESRRVLLNVKNKKCSINEKYLDDDDRKEEKGNRKRSNTVNEFDTNYYDHVKIRTRTIIIYISLFMFLSVILAFIPHLPSVNKDNQQIGSDSDSYVNWTKALIHSNSAVNFTKQAFFVQSSGERPLSLIFIYGIVKLFDAQNSLLTIIEHLPLILAPSLVFVSYFLTRELTSSDKASLVASFLTAVSFQTMVGVYAGYYANWIALIFGFSSIIFLIRFLKKRTVSNIALFLVLTISMLLSHQYTWAVFAIVMLVFLIAMIFTRLEIEGRYSRTGIILLILIVLVPVALGIGMTMVIGSGGGLLQDVSKAQAGLSINNFAARWSILKDTVFTYLGGLLSNFIILSLGLYWLYTCKPRDLASLFIFIFLSIGVIPIFFGDLLTQGRILYDIPFQIPAAIALTQLTKGRASVLLLPICIWIVLISVRAAANLYYVPAPS
ncbi:MAG: hypothetical protein WAM14_02790, partial [Candidatus Nitrosopolaris sp.]